MPARRRVVISGTGFSPIARHSDVPVGLLAVGAAKRAMDEAGIDASCIDGLATFPLAGHSTAGATDGIDFVTSEFMANALPAPNVRWRASIQPGDFASSIVAASHAIAAGACETVLAWRAMHNPRNVVYGTVSGAFAEGEYEFSAPYGVGDALSKFAMPYSRYMAKYGARREHMATFVVRNRANAALNPDAVFFAKPLEVSDYLGSKMVIEPFSVLDCDMPVDGAGAVILTTEENARSGGHPAVHISAGSSLGLNTGNKGVVVLEDHEQGAAKLAESLWRQAPVGPSDLGAVNLYDGFSYFVYLYLEAFGLCGRGEAFEFLQGPQTALSGALPVNPSGGNLGVGRLHGAPQIIDSVRQVQGRAGSGQIENNEAVLAVTGQPHYSAGALLLTKDALG